MCNSRVTRHRPDRNKMKIQVLVAFMFVAVVAAMADPNQVVEEAESHPLELGVAEHDVDTQGVSCIFGDWACSAHCRGIGRKGGRCIRGTCTCYN
ncbi:defensin-like [Colletes latitarsis]|uniref:defensin-like n=1 Tax=Colletes latitarsis TaxID=2605962 RepID=UPI004035C396